MRQCRLHALAVVLIVLSGAACGTSAPIVAPTPASASFEGYETGVCSAFGALLRAVGNMDAGTPSVLSKSLDDAVAAGDVAAADRAAAQVTSELETGRQQAAAAGRWPPAQPTMPRWTPSWSRSKRRPRPSWRRYVTPRAQSLRRAPSSRPEGSRRMPRRCRGSARCRPPPAPLQSRARPSRVRPEWPSAIERAMSRERLRCLKEMPQTACHQGVRS